jgi:hypothetical protein
MPNISKCPGDGCDMKNFCYRYRAKPSENQVVHDFTTSVTFTRVLGCDGFIRAVSAAEMKRLDQQMRGII